MSAAELGRPHVHRFVSRSRQSRWQIDQACDDRMPSNECECAGRSSFRLLLVQNRADQVLRDLFEMRRLHRVAGAALGKRTDRGSVTEHSRKRNYGVHNRKIAARFDVADMSAE